MLPGKFLNLKKFKNHDHFKVISKTRKANFEFSLSNALKSHNNNFNLARIILAVSVMFYHAFSLNTLDKNVMDPVSLFLIKLCGIDLGRFAVDMFFVISGIFVFQSWLSDPHLGRFAARRLTRLLPGLFFCTIFLGLIAVIFYSDEGYRFLFNATPWLFFIKTSFLLDVFAWRVTADYRPMIDGVFSSLEINAFNGSLWSLIWEARLYFLLGLSGSVLWLNKKIVLLVIVSIFLLLMKFRPEPIKLIIWEFDVFSCFLFGMVIAGMADLIKHSWIWLIFTSIGISIYGTAHLVGVLLVGMSILIWLASLQTGLFKRFQSNDYSYGVYIYHWPVIQMIRSTMDTVGPIDLFLIAGFFVFPIAAFSWHFIERPTIELMKSLLRHPKSEPRSI